MSGDVDLSIADYLKSVANFTAANSPSAVTWADRGIESEIISPLYDKVDADDEAVRQAAFLEGPLVEDLVIVDGARRDLMGKTITFEGNFLDYLGGLVGFVIGFSELETGMTELAIVRPLS